MKGLGGLLEKPQQSGGTFLNTLYRSCLSMNAKYAKNVGTEGLCEVAVSLQTLLGGFLVQKTKHFGGYATSVE